MIQNYRSIVTGFIIALVLFLGYKTLHKRHICTSYARKTTAECLNKQLKKYNPPKKLQKQLNKLFPNKNLFVELEQTASPRNYLESLGFRVLQFIKPTDTVILESDMLPGWIIKFTRVSAPAFVEKGRHLHEFATKFQFNPHQHIKKIHRAPMISKRVIQARILATIIDNHNYRYVAVPQKYFYCIDDVAMVLAEKIIPSGRTLQDLNKKEITEILDFVAASRGMVDMNPKNMILTKDKIVFIDTERAPAKSLKMIPSIAKKALPAFKKAINPEHRSLVDAWAKKYL